MTKTPRFSAIDLVGITQGSLYISRDDTTEPGHDFFVRIHTYYVGIFETLWTLFTSKYLNTSSTLFPLINILHRPSIIIFLNLKTGIDRLMSYFK